jgi:natural product biosynthesis luciferase-like monooxygenase protein
MSADTDIPSLLREALTSIRSLRAELAERERAARAPIAIIGASCRFPGGANNLEAFARVLREGVDAVGPVPANRWDADLYYDPDPATPGKIISREGAFLEGIDQFDAEFFGITPREAEQLDPQQRMLLEVAWEALENAGCPPQCLCGSRTGVFTGLMYGDYAIRALRENGVEGIDAYLGTGGTFSATAGRLAYVFGFQGPTMAVDTACSSSLLAVHLACQSLRAGECDLALAGGVNALLTPEPSINLSRARMLSPRGRCRTFDASADGYVRGEGCGIVILKPLARARDDGDRILGVIRGSAVNQDGRSSGLTAPNGQAQQALLRAALRAADVQPEDIGYVECHGSGTPLGDPIEVHALREVLGRGRPADRILALGSVKTNFGHLEGAAGICGLLKALLVVRGGEVFPHLHLEKLNPSIDFDGTPMAIPTSPMPWFINSGLRIAGVSSFGFVGTNVHIIVESPPGDEQVRTGPANDASVTHVLTLSARSKPALQELAWRHAQWFEEHPQVELASVARTLNAGRSHFENRAALIASSSKEAVDGLHALAHGETPTGAVCGQAAVYERPSLAFMFTGQGAQHPGMGRKLVESEPVFRDALRRCEEALEPRLPRPLTELLFVADENTLNETAVAQPALFALEYALTELWASWGVWPDFLLGHSLGEFVAACVAGIFSFEDALRLVAERGRLIQALPRGGKMAAVLAGEAEVLPVLARREDRLAIAAFNAPAETVLSGAELEMEAALADLARAGVTTCKLRASHAFHSPLMRPVLTEFEEVLASVTFSPPKRPITNSVTGALDTTHAMAQPEYWLQQLVSPVRLQGSVTALAGAGASVFLEVGPRPVLAALGPKIIPDSALTWLSSLRGPREDGMTPWRSAARLYAAGVEFDWDGMHAHRGGRKISLPTYPFQRRRFWLPVVSKARATAPFEPCQAVRPAAQESAHSAMRVAQSANLQTPSSGIRFSVMFFAATQNPMDGDKYRLVLEAARFADRHGFASVWIPERHFTNMGSLYPNPAVLHAALARETRRVRLMAGSVVAPLHNPIRIAEEWAMVDNLSGGRVGVSFASGWNPDDFAFFPERYPGRRELLYETLAIVRRLWRGEEMEITSGTGGRTRVRIFPTPLQKELPFWITAAGNPQTFREAGELGANLLTHLLDQDLNDLTEKIRLYREARALHGHDPASGCVTIMVHTFVGAELTAAREAVRVPFCNYLKASRNLLAGLAHSRGRQVDVAALSERDVDDLVTFLFERFADTRALLGTPASCEALVRRLETAGVNEIASLLDFGQKVDDVIEGLPWLRALKEQVEASPAASAGRTPFEPARHHFPLERDLPSDWFYEPVWRHLPRPVPTNTSTTGRWLIFADSEGFGAQLATVLGSERCVLVRDGAGFGDGNERDFWVDRLQSDAVASFFRGHGREAATAGGIVFLWPLDATSTNDLKPGSLATSQMLTVESARQLVQGLAGAAPGRVVPVWFVTRGAVQTEPAEQALAVAQAPLLGFARGVSQEHPGLHCRLVDLDPVASADANAALLAAHMGAQDPEDKVAFRRGSRLGERLVPLKSPAAAVRRWECRADATYLITGGLGGVGLKVAEWLVERGARHLLLVGRSSPGVMARQVIASLQAQRCTVMVAAADVADESAIREILSDWRMAARPPIRGVMHAAGSWHDVPVAQMDAGMLASVLAPKTIGTWVLEGCLANQPLDFFVSFSSLSSLWPAYGQTNYAAANAFLDAHGQWRRSVGQHALSVNWGPWSDIGFGATEKGVRAHERLEAFGVHRLAPSEALDVLGLLLARDIAQAVVVKMDWAMLGRVDPPLARTPFLSELTGSLVGTPTAPTPEDGLRQLLELTPSSEHSALIQAAVAAIVARVLHLQQAELRVDEPLRKLGIDSLMAVEIKNRLQTETGVNVPLAHFLEGASVVALAQLVQIEMKLSRLTRTDGPEVAEAVVEEFAL